MRRKLIWMVLAVLPLLGACTGPKGDTGLMGPSGAGTPVYYYNNTFDSGGVSEWRTFKWAGAGDVVPFLDATTFVSPGNSLCVSFTALTGIDSLAYLSLPINPTLDCWTEFDWNMQGASAWGFEFVQYMNGPNKIAILGFDSTNLYLVEGSTKVIVAPQPTLGFWHHVVIKVNANTFKSSYWLDGLTLGTGYQTNEAPASPTPPGYLIGLDNQAGPDSITRIDNLKCYHY